jgi:hypothetical protein
MNTETMDEVLSVQEMQNVVELLSLYSEINAKVIDHKRNTSREFVSMTKLINDIISVMKDIPIKLDE